MDIFEFENQNTMDGNNSYILVADDDEEDLEMIEEAILSVEPYTAIRKVRTGQSVINTLSNTDDHNLPSLIILDYSMPELNGAQVLAIICNDSRYVNIPMVVLSTSNSPSHIQECKYNGATEYFVKPNTLAELRSLVEKMLSLR